ncbi:MAG: hypothetical protein R3B84_08120 [Zavarzinella sp.]
MNEVLAELLNRLIAIKSDHSEICDTEVRERLDSAIHDGFLTPTQDYELPNDFGMYSPEGNLAVKNSLGWFLPAAMAACEAEELFTFHERLDAFQSLDVRIGPKQICYNDFFGYTDPKRYDENGNFIKR